MNMVRSTLLEKHVAAQITNEVGEFALGLTAVVDVGGHATCSRPSLKTCCPLLESTS